MNDITREKRVNDILLGPLERPALHWLAARMPAWVTPDVLTVTGFAGGVLVGVAYYLTNFDNRFLWLASLAFIINWFGDSLDGTLARLRKIERPRYGFFIDHTTDSLVEVIIFLGIGLSPYVDFSLACLALAGYLLLSILVFVKTYVDGVFRISWARLGPTEMRLLAIAANTVVFFIGNPVLNLPFGQLSLYNTFIAFLALVLFVGYIVIVLQQAAVLAKNEQARAGGMVPVTGKKRKTKNKVKVYGPGGTPQRQRSSSK